MGMSGLCPGLRAEACPRASGATVSTAANLSITQSCLAFGAKVDAMNSSQRTPSAQEVERAIKCLKEYEKAANPLALASIVTCLAGPVLLSGSEFLAAFPDLVPVLCIVMLVAWINGCTILIARHHALHARRLLSKAQATSIPLQ